MSFHHAPLGKGSSPSDIEPLGNAAKQINSTTDQASAAETSANNQVDASATYDEEARFELLSAYLDDEVTPQERKLVSQWLMDDPNTLQMYRRLLMLRQAIRTAPIHPPVETTTLQVPTPPQSSWDLFSSSTFRRTLIFAIAITLLGSLGQLSTASGRQQVQEAWQFIKSLPQSILLEPASETAHQRQIDNFSPSFSKGF